MKKASFVVLFFTFFLILFLGCVPSKKSVKVIPADAQKCSVINILYYDENAVPKQISVSDEIAKSVIAELTSTTMHLVTNYTRKAQGNGFFIHITFEINDNFSQRQLYVGSGTTDECIVEGVDTKDNESYILDDTQTLYKRLQNLINP